MTQARAMIAGGLAAAAALLLALNARMRGNPVYTAVALWGLFAAFRRRKGRNRL